MKASEARALLRYRELLIEHYQSRDPRGGRSAAVAAVAGQVGPQGMRRLAEAEQAVAYMTHDIGTPAASNRKKAKMAKKARKAAKARESAEDALIRHKVSEALAARGITESRTAGLAGGEPPRPLHEMTLEELEGYASGAISDYGRQAGLQSPYWTEDSHAR